MLFFILSCLVHSFFDKAFIIFAWQVCNNCYKKFIMHRLLTLVLFFYTGNLYAQTPKIVSGIYTYNADVSDYHRPYSIAGNSIALERGNAYVLFDVQKGTIYQKNNKELSKISSNHRYLFQFSLTFAPDRVGEPGPGGIIRSEGIYTDTAVHTIYTDYIPLDIDEKGNILASKTWYDPTRLHRDNMKGLYKLDRTTGNLLQTITEDTLLVCKGFSGCGFKGLYPQKNYFAFSSQTYAKDIDIYPFNGAKKVTIPAHGYKYAYADSSIIFTVADSTNDIKRITAFDVRTGLQLAQMTSSKPIYTEQHYGVAGNKMYILQAARAVIEEWSITKGVFTNSKNWDLFTNLGLAKDQRYKFFVVKGPSFFVVPYDMEKAEAGGFAANTAHFFNGASKKINMQVFPFYNRTPNDVAIQKKNQEEQDARVAKYQAQQDMQAHPEKYCHVNWNTEKWRKGITIKWGGAFQILADYDCKKDQYKLWRPNQLYEGNGHYMTAKYEMVSGYEIRGGNFYSPQQYVTCTYCEGDGTYERTVYTTTTKELPWGYFSGIETKKITSKSTTSKVRCSKCEGNGVVLQ
jgi:hypothetical protein